MRQESEHSHSTVTAQAQHSHSTIRAQSEHRRQGTERHLAAGGWSVLGISDQDLVASFYLSGGKLIHRTGLNKE